MMSLGARVATLACLFVAINAFVAPPQKFPGRAMSSATQHQMSPVDVAMAADSLSVVSQLPTQLVSLEVTTAAFLAVRAFVHRASDPCLGPSRNVLPGLFPHHAVHPVRRLQGRQPRRLREKEASDGRGDTGFSSVRRPRVRPALLSLSSLPFLSIRLSFIHKKKRRYHLLSTATKQPTMRRDSGELE
mmetsp:Transcript_7069/g.23203  ORF Transcript_7069/g.23203 Transcript_7069/m.23203 type:complete len:188 (+) Transcript_7069:117-680(+)